MATPSTFKPAKLNTCGNDLTKRWFVYFSCIDPTTSKIKRIKYYEGFSKFLTVLDRTAYGKELARKINRKLKRGWNYFNDKASIISDTPAKPAQTSPILPGIPLERAFYLILQEQKIILRKRTYRTYLSHLKIFRQWLAANGFENASVSEVSPENGRKFLEHLIAKGMHNTTRNHYLGTLRTIFTHLHEKGYVAENPFQSLKKLRTNKQGYLYFKSNQVELLKKHISVQEPQLWFFIQLMFNCFIRPNELQSLTVGDIDIHNEKIRIRGDISKNKKSEFVIIPPALMNAIWESGILDYPDHFFIFGKDGIPAEKQVSEHFFRNKHKPFMQKFKFSDEYKLYSWKHTGICTAALNGVPLPFIQQQARHHSLDQLYAYMKRMGITDMERFKEKFPVL
jgi:site-specific recombinase XerD